MQATLKTYPGLANNGNHTDVASVDTKVKWNSNPPTSGPHYGQWAVWNFYDSPVPLTMSTHNLEHGGIVIHYGPRIPQSDRKLTNFYERSQRDDRGALPSAGNKVIASAWFFDEAKGRDDSNYKGENRAADHPARPWTRTRSPPSRPVPLQGRERIRRRTCSPECKGSVALAAPDFDRRCRGGLEPHAPLGDTWFKPGAYRQFRHPGSAEDSFS